MNAVAEIAARMANAPSIDPDAIRTPLGTLTQWWDSFQHRNGDVRLEKLWWFIPYNFGERRCLGLVSEVSRDEAMKAVMS